MATESLFSFAAQYFLIQSSSTLNYYPADFHLPSPTPIAKSRKKVIPTRLLPNGKGGQAAFRVKTRCRANDRSVSRPFHFLRWALGVPGRQFSQQFQPIEMSQITFRAKSPKIGKHVCLRVMAEAQQQTERKTGELRAKPVAVFISVQDGVGALGKAHNYALYPVSQRFPRRCLSNSSNLSYETYVSCGARSLMKTNSSRFWNQIRQITLI